MPEQSPRWIWPLLENSAIQDHENFGKRFPRTINYSNRSRFVVNVVFISIYFFYVNLPWISRSSSQVDEFIIECVLLGRIESLRVWLDPESQPSESWYLAWVQVTSVDSEALSNGTLSPETFALVKHQSCLFDIHQWFHMSGGSRELEVNPMPYSVGSVFGLAEDSELATPLMVTKLVRMQHSRP